MSNDIQEYIGKLDVTNQIGETLDKQLQLAENTVQQYLGGSIALKQAAAKVGELGVHVDKDLEEGKLEFETTLAAAAYTKRYIIRATEVLLNLAERSKSEELVAHGKAAALKESLEIVKKHAVNAKARAEQIIAAQDEAAKEIAEGKPQDTEGQRRRPGEHPGPSSLDERRAERDRLRAEQAAQESIPAGQPTASQDAPEQPSDPFEPPAVRQKRPYKRRQKAVPSSDGAT